jgi:2-polyprenyl-3-methyl-5-hydroxy-6-metoxy-1,4-benzoquinol methylase
MLRVVRKTAKRRPDVKDYSESYRTGMDEASLDANTSLAKMLAMVGRDKVTLDVGCAGGYFARLMADRGCDVTGLDINSAAVEQARRFYSRVLVADIDAVPLPEAVEGARFDVVVFGDVLEHLRNPVRILDETRQILNKSGYVVASIPNIAHGAVRLALLKGSFEYGEVGLLDDSHVRFFTARSVEELFAEAGYRIDQIERTSVPVFSGSNLVPKVDRAAFPDAVISEIEADPESETLQFIIKAKPLSDKTKTRTLVKQLAAAHADLKTLGATLQRHESEKRALQAEVEAALATATQARAAAEAFELRCCAHLDQTAEAAEALQTEVEAAQAAAQAQEELAARYAVEIENLRHELEAAQTALQTNQDLLASAQAEVVQVRAAAETAAVVQAQIEAQAAVQAQIEAQAAVQAQIEAQAAAQAQEELAAQEARINDLADELETSGRSLREINIRLRASSDELERRTSELAAAWRANDDLRSRWRTAYGELEQRFIGQTDNIIAHTRAEIDDVSVLIGAVQGSSFWSFKLAVVSIRPALAKLLRMLSLQRQP